MMMQQYIFECCKEIPELEMMSNLRHGDNYWLVAKKYCELL